MPSILLNLSLFFVFTNISFLYLYPIALADMGIEHHEIGFIMGLFSVAAVLSRPVMGKLVAMKGERLIVSAGMAVNLIASLSYILITTFGPAMLIIRIVHGIGFSAFISAAFSMAAKTSHPNKRGETFSFIGASILGAVALAPPLGEFMVRQWGFTSLYLAASGATILAWICMSISIQPATPSRHTAGSTPVKYSLLLQNKAFLFLLISTLIFAHCQATVPYFLPLIATEKGVPIGRFFLVSYSTAILVLLFMGKLTDQYGKLFFMKLSYPFFSLGILLMPVMLGPTSFAVPAVLFGFGIGLLFATHNALAASYGSRMDKPAAMSLFTTIYDTGFITGAIVSGWLAHQTSLDILFVTCGILGFLGFLIVIFSPITED
ncbi:MAG: MFS transporter [Desulfobacterales bacterium]|nr:MFS transporter [Desulfobacterales bacterium]